jgi:hypothetical protein
LVFPEVFSKRGGFDSIVGNPPFLGGAKITPSMGVAYRQMIAEHVSNGVSKTNTDLVAFFLMRCSALVGQEGALALLATNSLAQGDTRAVGLEQLLSSGWTINRAIRSEPWPSRSAALEYCAVWMGRIKIALKVLDGGSVPGITASLSAATRLESKAFGLVQEGRFAFIGHHVNGSGFVLNHEEASRLLARAARNADVVFPYVIGQDLNQSPTSQASRWVINFGERDLDQARSYPDCLEIVERLVRPEREGRNRAAHGRRWWRFADYRKGMEEAISGVERCVALAQVSKTVMPVMVSARQVFSHKVIVFATEDYADLALYSSCLHYWWALDRSATMKADLSYSPSDVAVTFVRPTLTTRLRTLGGELDAHRRDLMADRKMGLTSVYNLVHIPDCQDEDIVELRRIHEAIDKATVEAYGWHDLLDHSGQTPPIDPTHEAFPLDHGFHETDQGTRYTIGLLARTEIIDRLRQLNHQAYADEVHLGLHKGVMEKKAREKHPDLPPPSPEAIRKRKEQLAARGGSDIGEGIEGALF